MPTVLHRLARWADEDPEAVAQRYKSEGTWKEITTEEYRDRVLWLALFLESRGIRPGQAGAILSYNCPEWVHLDLATLLIGASSAGLYPNSMSKDIHYILGHTEARVLGVQHADYFRKVTGPKGEHGLPEAIDLVIVFDGDTSISPKAVSYSQAIEEGRALAARRPGALNELLGRIDPGAGSFLIYTSGTTGSPKGAMVSHDNLAFTSDMVARHWRIPTGTQTMFSFLPLCHVAEKLQCVGVGISSRCMVSFCTKFEHVAAELPEVQPTLLLCVPRLWEKMMEGVLHKIARGKGAKKRLAEWALATGARTAVIRFSGRVPSPLDLARYRLADKLVLSKIRHALGLGKAQLLASGAAALPAHVSRWFRSLGLEILEDFGQTESTGVICMTEYGVDSAGTVGKPLPGFEVRLAEDGEVLTRGRHVFVGYFKDEAATAQALERDRWLHTGDLGEWDPRGLLRIRGRKKEVLKTSGGKMIAPLPIEERLKAAPIISQVCMVGDGRKYLSALITLSESRLGELKERGALESGTVGDQDTLAEVRTHIDELNGQLAGFEQIKQFTVLSREFSIENGEMTPTLKMKRNVIETNFREVIDGMYS